jgi:hypothetical protein
MSSSLIVIAGFSDDVALVRSRLPNVPGIVSVDENTDESQLANVRIVVYLFSKDTGYSSQLLSRFTSIHFRTKPQEEYVMSIGDVDLAKRVFDALKSTPVISTEALAARLEDGSGDLG